MWGRERRERRDLTPVSDVQVQNYLSFFFSHYQLFLSIQYIKSLYFAQKNQYHPHSL